MKQALCAERAELANIVATEATFAKEATRLE